MLAQGSPEWEAAGGAAASPTDVTLQVTKAAGAQPQPDDSDIILDEYVLPDELSPPQAVSASMSSAPQQHANTPSAPPTPVPFPPLSTGTPASLPGGQSTLVTPDPLSRLRAMSMPNTATVASPESTTRLSTGGSPAGSDNMVAL